MRAKQRRVVDERDERGSLEIYLPSPHHCITIATGHCSASMARAWIEAMTPHLEGGSRFVTFHDWELMTTYDSGARRALTSWVVANTRAILSADFLVTSRLVAMGVAAASVMTSLSGLALVAHTRRGEFEAALERSFASTSP